MMCRKIRLLLLLTTIAILVLLPACGKKESTDYEKLRDVSWEGTELTIKLGENKSTGCVWKTDPQDDAVIDYSTNRVFHLAGGKEAVGTLEAGFKGKGAGTSQIICTTPVSWDGKGDGYTYIVTVTVDEDGTIKDAKGEESVAAPAESSEDAEETESSEKTLEKYFAEHPDELETVKKNLNDDEKYKGVVDIDVKAQENTLIYIFKFKETYTKEQVEAIKPKLKESMETNEMKKELGGKIKTMEEGFGVKGIKIYMEYQNGDGAKLYGGTFE